MHLHEMAHRAWHTAEAKGLHANLDGVDTLGAREQALLTLIPITLQLNEIIQAIKKQGVSLAVWDTVLHPGEQSLYTLIKDSFDQLLHFCGRKVLPMPVSPMDQRLATALRLLLVGTEVCEAQELLAPDARNTIRWQESIRYELSDILIRVGDIAHGLQIDLDRVTETVMDANDDRPYQYGTPEEHHHG